MSIKVIKLGPLEVNCSIIKDENKSVLIVDPGADKEKILREISDCVVIAIICTHGHTDHIGQVKELKEILGVPFYIHEKDVVFVENKEMPDKYLEDGMKINIGDLEIEAIHTPGHTPGHCCLYIAKEKTLIAGDLLFKESVGRWDFPGGDHNALKNSIRKIFTRFNDETKVITGHGECTTIYHERKTNKFVLSILSPDCFYVKTSK